MKRMFYIPVVLGLVAVGMITVAAAAPRDASSKIRGNYAFDSSRSTRSTMSYRAAAPSIVRAVPAVPQHSAPEVARTQTNRQFSHEPRAAAAPAPHEMTVPAPARRRFSYEPRMADGSATRRAAGAAPSHGFSPNRGADFKIRGNY